MNKTITANISGFIFNIEEDAYKLLVDYLEAIKAFFSSAEGGDEIIVDIESRIAELFSERLSENKQVILKQDVEEVIDIMGRPEQYREEAFEAEEPEAAGTQAEPDAEEFKQRHQNRRIYRDPDDSVIGGICSGISYYFGWDPIWIRLGFVLFALLGGAAILLYIILWIVMPEAKTTAEKLQMKGEPVTVENIRKHVNDTMDDVKEGAKKFSEETGERVSEGGRKARGFFSQLGEGLGNAFGLLGKIIAKLIGLALVLGGTGILIGSIIGLVAADHALFATGLGWDQFEHILFLENGTLTLGFLGAILVTISVVFAMFYGGLKLLLEFRTRIRGLGITLFCLFVIGVVLGCVAGWQSARHFTHDAEIYEEYVLDSPDYDTLYVNVMEDPYFSDRICRDHDETFEFVKFEDEHIILGTMVSLHFYENDDDTLFQINVEYESNGLSRSDAFSRVEAIEHEYTLEGDSLNISPYLKIPEDDRWTGQNVDIRVYVPEGKYVQMGEHIGRLYWRCNYGGKLVRMEDDGWDIIRD